MHELAIVDEIIRTVEEEKRRAGHGGRVTALNLRVGALSCASAEALRHAFGLMALGSSSEGAKLVIETTALEGVCQACGARSELDDLRAACPACGSADVRMEGDSAVVLESIEIEE